MPDIEIEKLSPQMVESFERLNLYFHVHKANEDILNNAIQLVENLNKEPGTTLSPEHLIAWVESVGYVCQTVDALMHILQRGHTGPAYEFSRTLTDEQKMFIRDNLHTPTLDKMLAILSEDEETRTQRMLLEHLGIHE